MKAAFTDSPPGEPHYATVRSNPAAGYGGAIGPCLIAVVLLMGSVYIMPMALDSVLGLCLLYQITRDHDWRLKCATLWRDPLSKCWLLLLTYIGLSLFWSQQWQFTDLVQVSLRALLCLCFIYTLSNGAGENRSFARLLWRTVAICALTSALICIFLWFYAPPDHDRLTGLFRLNNAGKAGRMYAAALPILLSGCLLDRGQWKALSATALLASLVALVGTDTRSAWLAGLVGSACLLIAIWQPRPRTFVILTVSLGGALLAALLAVATHPNPEVSAALLPRGDSLRLEIWAAHLRHAVQEFPLFGGGLLAELEVALDNRAIRGAHSMYLSTAFQLGLPGLALFGVTSLWTGLRLLRHLQLPVARLALSLLLLGLTTYVFNGDRLIDKLNFVWFVTWFPLGVALSLRGRPQAESHSPAA